MEKIFETKTFWVIVLIPLIVNVIISLIIFNLASALGWLAALCFFPYENIFKIKKNWRDRRLPQNLRKR